MTEQRPGTPGSYFEDMYRRADDPWHLSERWYEQRKYDLTVAALPLPRYRRAFEPACSVGELTLRLARGATHCWHATAWPPSWRAPQDVSPGCHG